MRFFLYCLSSNVSALFNRSKCVFNLKLCCNTLFCVHRTLHFCNNRYHESVLQQQTHSLKNEFLPSRYREILEIRQKQAYHSVLIELSSKEDIPFVLDICKQFGHVEKAILHPGVSSEVFLLIEFIQADAVSELLKYCQFKQINNTFPLYSRLIRYERKWKKQNVTKNCVQQSDVLNVPEVKNASEFQPLTVSQLIKDNFDQEVLDDKSFRLRFLFARLLQDAVGGMFPFSEVVPFGSSVNGFGKEGCDLDLVLRLYPIKIERRSELYFQTRMPIDDIRVLQQNAIISLARIIRTFFPGVPSVQRILNARVPIIKFAHNMLNLKCDVSVNNMGATYMSEILFFCGEVDERVRPLVSVVKKWAKEANITYETPGSWITNFSLTLLVLFFLQNRPVPILPPLDKAFKISVNEDPMFCDGVKYIKEPAVWKLLAVQNDESLELLLKEFFNFLVIFPFQEKCISLLSGEAISRKERWPLMIQYPIEETANVTKNVSLAELKVLTQAAGVSLKHLNENSCNSICETRNLMLILGIPALKKMYAEKNGRISISEIYDVT